MSDLLSERQFKEFKTIQEQEEILLIFIYFRERLLVVSRMRGDKIILPMEIYEDLLSKH